LVHYQNLSDPTQIIADMLAAISRAKDEVVDAKRYAKLADDMRVAGGGEPAERAAEVAVVYDRYEKLKREAHCVDFGDLVSLPVRLLETNEAIRAHLQAEYDYVLVDEYQDVNRSSALPPSSGSASWPARMVRGTCSWPGTSTTARPQVRSRCARPSSA